jgi:hypothetical protein
MYYSKYQDNFEDKIMDIPQGCTISIPVNPEDSNDMNENMVKYGFCRGRGKLYKKFHYHLLEFSKIYSLNCKIRTINGNIILDSTSTQVDKERIYIVEHKYEDDKCTIISSKFLSKYDVQFDYYVDNKSIRLDHIKYDTLNFDMKELKDE